jgi:hypothetical protein
MARSDTLSSVINNEINGFGYKSLGRNGANELKPRRVVFEFNHYLTPHQPDASRRRLLPSACPFVHPYQRSDLTSAHRSFFRHFPAPEIGHPNLTKKHSDETQPKA